ncbi:MAG: PhnD/SsuA/transferrin family substrate-binding protein [Methylobacter sp.]
MFLNSAKRIARNILMLVFVIVANVAEAGDLFAEQTLRVGFHRPSFHEYSREDLEISVKVLTEEMGNEIGIQTSVMIYEDIDLMRKDFEQGKINLIFASPILIATQFDNTLLADGFKMVPSGGTADNLIVLTRKNERMDKFNLLRGRKLGLTENDPIIDLYVNLLSRSNFNSDYKGTFNVLPKEKKSIQVILKLFFGQADVVCVYDNFYQTMGELNPQILSKIQIIERIDGILQGAGFFHKNVDPGFREHVIAAAIKLNTNIRGRQFLEIFKTEKAQRVSPTELSMTRQLYTNYQRLTKIK